MNHLNKDLNMKKILKLYEKLAYGRILICCEDEIDQINITTLTGKKTLSEKEITALEELGVIVSIRGVNE
jgi:hypothetical protein